MVPKNPVMEYEEFAVNNKKGDKKNENKMCKTKVTYENQAQT